MSIVGIAGEVGLHPERPEVSLPSLGDLQLQVAGSTGTNCTLGPVYAAVVLNLLLSKKP